MTEKLNIVILANAAGAVKAFRDIAGGAAASVVNLAKVGQAGKTSLDQVAASTVKTERSLEELAKATEVTAAEYLRMQAAANSASGQSATGLTKVTGALSAVDRAAAGVAGASLIGFLSDSARASADAEVSMARLAQAFENAGSSVDEHADRLAAASEKALALGFDDEDAADAIAGIAAVTGNASGAIDKLNLTMDIARARSMDLGSAASLVGKVAAGNTEILQRYGIVLEKGATAEEALAALQQKFGGQAVAYANTQRGAIDRLSVGWENFQEQVGATAGPLAAMLGVLPGVSAGFQGATGAASALTTRLPSLQGNLGAVALGFGAVTAAAGLVVLAYQQQEEGARRLITAYDDVNKAALANAAILDKAAAGPVKFEDLIGNPADMVNPFTEQSKAVLAAQQRLGDYRLSATDVLLTTAAAADVMADEASALGHVTQGAGELVAAQSLLNSEINSHNVLAKDAIPLADNLAKLYGEQGSRGEIAQKALVGINAEYARTHDAGAYAAAVQGVVDTLGDQASAADKAAAANRRAAAAASIRQQPETGGVISFPTTASSNTAALTEIRAAADANREASDQGKADLRDLAAAAGLSAQEVAAAWQLMADEGLSAEAAIARVQQGIAAGFKSMASDAMSAVGLVGQAADAQVSAVRDAEAEVARSADATADKAIAAAERSGAQQTRAAQAAGHETARAAELAGRDQVRAAEVTEHQQVTAAQAAAEGQIAAAKEAEKGQVEAAQAAEEAQVKAAERAGQAQVREAEVAGRAQVRQATATAHDQVRAANLAATAQENAADHLEESVAASAKAQEESIIEAAKAAADERTKQAEKTADAEIAAAKRSTDRQLFELERRTAAQQRAATAATGEAIQKANDAAFKAIKGGAPVGKVAGNLAKAQRDAFAEETRAQEDILRKQENAQERIQATEDQRIADANAAKEAAAEASAKRLAAIEEQAQAESQARTEAASREAERMRTAAARNVSQVEKATAHDVALVQRNVDRQTAAAERASARETARVKEAAAAHTAAVQEAAAANTAAVTEQANREAEQVATEAARNTERARTEAARNVTLAERETGREVKAIARDTADAQKIAAHDRETALKASADRIAEAERTSKAAADEATSAILIGAAKADPELAKILEAQGAIREGAQGQFEVIIDDPSQQAIAKIDEIFGGDAAQLDAHGSVTIVADFSAFNAQMRELAAHPVGTASVAVQPTTASSTRLGTARRLGGMVERAIVPARNGRLVDVSMNEAGGENVVLPGGSLVIPHPASQARNASLSGLTLQFNGPVYGFDDFKDQVGRAAVEALSRALPAAIADRRRALGAA